MTIPWKIKIMTRLLSLFHDHQVKFVLMSAFSFSVVKQIAKIRLRSWVKSVALPPNDEYWDFLRCYDLTVARTIDLLLDFIDAAVHRATVAKDDAAERNTEYDAFVSFLFKRLGDALDEEYAAGEKAVYEVLAREETRAKIQGILRMVEKLDRVKAGCKEELELLAEIVEEEKKEEKKEPEVGS